MLVLGKHRFLAALAVLVVLLLLRPAAMAFSSRAAALGLMDPKLSTIAIRCCHWHGDEVLDDIAAITDAWQSILYPVTIGKALGGIDTRECRAVLDDLWRSSDPQKKFLAGYSYALQGTFPRNVREYQLLFDAIRGSIEVEPDDKATLRELACQTLSSMSSQDTEEGIQELLEGDQLGTRTRGLLDKTLRRIRDTRDDGVIRATR